VNGCGALHISGLYMVVVVVVKRSQIDGVKDGNVRVHILSILFKEEETRLFCRIFGKSSDSSQREQKPVAS
jgi:hypothetical protein